MRRHIAVVLSAVLVWHGLGGTVALASQHAARDDWTRVTALKPNQKVTVEPQKGRGKKQSGRFVACDATFIILRNNKGQNVAFAKDDVRRIGAVTPGRESYFALGVAAVVAATAAGIVRNVSTARRLNSCQSYDCNASTGVDAAFILVKYLVMGGGIVVSWQGSPRRVFQAPEIQPPPTTPRGEVRTSPEPGSAPPGGTPATDPLRVIGAIRQAPGPGLRLVTAPGAIATNGSVAGPATEARREGQQHR